MQKSRRAVVHGLSVDDLGHASVRLCDERDTRVTAQPLELEQHLVRPVEQLSSDALHHGQRRGHVRARQAPAALVAGEGDKDRLVAHTAHCEHCCACVGQGHHRLYHEEVDPRLLKPRGLLGVYIHKLLKCGVSERREEASCRRNVTRDPRAAVRRLPESEASSRFICAVRLKIFLSSFGGLRRKWGSTGSLSPLRRMRAVNFKHSWPHCYWHIMRMLHGISSS